MESKSVSFYISHDPPSPSYRSSDATSVALPRPREAPLPHPNPRSFVTPPKPTKLRRASLDLVKLHHDRKAELTEGV
ncbi:hypothetical protein TIFTF001_017039 [Ficus carica]|uniref:Uncharacterized protein n=1 Tax=Ficus carica TaxID=3494 RepID=A0AA88A8I6_FICCA|nr:hypothetical protein TIFTF001_017039 [Ficus carica]